MIDVFGHPVLAAPLAILISLFAAEWLAGKRAAAHRLDPDRVGTAVSYATVAGILVSRLGYVAANFEAYLRSPLDVLSPLPAAFMPWVGWVAGLVVCMTMLWRTRPEWSAVLDLFGVPVLIVLAGWAVSDHFGALRSGLLGSPVGILIPFGGRHPIALYEAGALILGAIALLALSRRGLPNGVAAMLTIAIFGLARLLSAGFEQPAVLIAGLRISQLLALGAAVTALAGASVLLMRASHAVGPEN